MFHRLFTQITYTNDSIITISFLHYASRDTWSRHKVHYISSIPTWTHIVPSIEPLCSPSIRETTTTAVVAQRLLAPSAMSVAARCMQRAMHRCTPSIRGQKGGRHEGASPCSFLFPLWSEPPNDFRRITFVRLARASTNPTTRRTR